MSIKHGLLMSLVLGTTAALGTFGGGAVLPSGTPVVEAASLTPTELASAKPMPSAAARSFTVPKTEKSPEIQVDIAPGTLEGWKVTPAKLASAAPVTAVAKEAVVAAPAMPLGTAASVSTKALISCSDIYLNFKRSPANGVAPMDVAFTCDVSYSDGQSPAGPTGTQAPVTAIQWFWKNPQTATTASTVQVVNPNQPFSSQPKVANFKNPGSYDIGMRVQLTQPDDPSKTFLCPPTTEPPFIIEAAVNVEAANENTAQFDATDLLCNFDSGGVLPLQDWIPVAGLVLRYSPSSPAPSVLAHLHLRVTDEFGVPLNEDDIQSFALFLDSSADGPADGDLDTTNYDGHVVITAGGGTFIETGRPMLTWGGDGRPFETPTSLGNFPTGDSNYNLNFVFNTEDPSFDPQNPLNPGNPQRPYFQFFTPPPPAVQIPQRELKWPIAWESETRKWGYILAMRTSAKWASNRGLRVCIDNTDIGNYFQGAEMLPYVDDVATELANDGTPMAIGPFPRGTDGAPADTYNPDFFNGAVLCGDCRRTGVFDVYDITGGLIRDSREYPDGVVTNYRASDWNWPNKLYTPVAEHTRPRWDKGDAAIDFVTGEWMDLRRVFSLEEWMPVIGINAHANCATYLSDINVILTDIGADPYGPPGNGGFNPTTGLHHMTTDVHGNFTSDQLGSLFATGLDYTFNGVGVFFDTGGGDPCTVPDGNCDGNGVFDPPTPLDPTGAGAGVGFTDLPLVPEPLELDNLQNEGYYQWEYVPFPPGGGDPWWRMRLRFATEGKVANFGDIGSRGIIKCDGLLENTPESELTNPRPEDADLFVVIRADSGFKDVSGLQGDGTGLPFGADTRAFIEPRSWNPLAGGHWEGGMRFSNSPTTVNVTYWQSDPQTGDQLVTDANGNITGITTVEPWFSERTINQDVVKPIRCGLDVHDYVLTYSSNNRYAKVSRINVGQRLFYTLPGSTEILEVPIFSNAFARTAFSLWMDPPIVRNGDDIPSLQTGLGIGQSAFEAFNNPGVVPDTSDGIAPAQDELTEIQYAYETVPFELDAPAYTGNNAPVSPYYPNPAPQPSLPDILNWPQLRQAVTTGERGYCYLADDKGNNESFTHPTSSNSEKTYEDDVYVFGDDTVSLAGVQPGMWLIDRYNAKYRILAVNGNEMTLAHGHSAYLDEYYYANGGPTTEKVSIGDWPFGITLNKPTYRGRWAVVTDALMRNEYPRQSNWPEGLSPTPTPSFGQPTRAARLLKQHVMQESQPTAVLGLNVAGAADPVVNASAEVTLRSITVAFWGPEFDPAQLTKLDEDGTLVSSGVLLYEDSNGSGTFDGPLFSDLVPTPAFTDRIVPLQGGSLAWSETPEPVDLNGDYVADDLSGDGVVVFSQDDVAALSPEDQAKWDGLFDGAWVLRVQPAGWTVPHTDFNAGLLSNPTKAAITAEMPELPNVFKAPDFWAKTPTTIDVGPSFNAKGAQKSLSKFGNFGDDLFVVIRTSEEAKSFEQIRCVVPSRLPTRTPLAEQIGGVQFSPRTYLSSGSFEKQSPEEGPVQDFYGHDMLEVSVPARVTDLSSSLLPNTATGGVLITPGGPPAAVLGIDASANRPENLIAAGGGGTVQNNIFTTGEDFTTAPSDVNYTGNAWTSEVVGYFLMTMSSTQDARDSRYEAYQITGVSGRNLTLQAGTPAADKPWQIVKDPTFLEQVIVELYDKGNDGGFDITQDLLPLNFEDPAHGQFSGVSLWRDNDLSPLNTNGVFDPPITDSAGNVTQYIDLPVRLDDQPELIGVAGEPQYQVRMVFSSPGTDNSDGRNTVPYTTQPLLRQPIPQEFGRASSDAAFGADFFVVLRTARAMDGGDDIQAAIVSWGPDTPTEPDPDNFSVSLGAGVPAGQPEDEFDLFSEFPATARGLGFITYFKNPQPVRYWSYDQDKRKIAPRTEVDHSQDNAPVKYWQRSTANVATRTQTITALPSPTVDFIADRHRQVVNEPVKFTLIITGTTTFNQVLWSFGDGTTATETNPSHSYAQSGIYDVSVTVSNQFGISVTKTKKKYIEIVDPPFADFIGAPTDATLIFEETKSPPIGRDVTFTDLSQGSSDYTATSWFWNFGDGTTLRATTGDNQIHRYTKEGFYTVTLEVTFTNNATSATITRAQRLVNYITIRACVGCPTGEGEGEGEGSTDTPAADFKVTSEVRDKEAIVPLSDWVPLVNFTMGYGPDKPALRNLQFLDLLIRSDGRGATDLGYANITGPDVTDLLEFGLFLETKNDDDAKNHELNIENDFLLYKWDNLGAPVGQVVGGGFGSIEYLLDFIGTGTAANPQFPVPAGPTGDTTIDGNSYIIAVRSSATWRSQITMRCDVLNARMISPLTGGFPVDKDGKAIDKYDPDFTTGKTLAEDVGYCSSFAVWSLVGSSGGTIGQSSVNTELGVGEYDAWANGRVLYTPMAEHSRPRWNSPGHLLNAVGGEFLQMRPLAALEQWVPVIGINAHSTKSVHMDDDVSGIRVVSGKAAAQLREVNVVLTDIGADPFGPPGNGGFNPNDMLRRVNLSSTLNDDTAFGTDCTFNGIWLWHDTNENGLFDPPAPIDGGIGVAMTGDRPMDPYYASAWEYDPLPPGGGDPWWKIKLGFFDGTRRADHGGDNVEGYLTPKPNNTAGLFGTSEYTCDYFVVVRPDSGAQDSSTTAGDGSGMAPGADFKAFIEPRRFNALTGHTDGGIYLDSMLPPAGLVNEFGTLDNPWQDDPNWGANEPWWPQRTVNANATQKVQAGLEIHDLVMSYESDGIYNVYSDLFFGNGSFTEDRSCLGYAIPGASLTDFDRWEDPLGLLAAQFLNNHTVGVTRFGIEDSISFTLANPALGFSDVLTFSLIDLGSQYSFETVPFNNGYDGGTTPRSAAYPTPPAQPTLPEYATWSFNLKPGEYPRLSQWDDDQNRARILSQKTDIEGDVTAMLGINAVGSADPFVNRGTPPAIRDITVAFWGPTFTPEKLLPLDPNGQDTASGVMLWEDADKDTGILTSIGTFFPPSALQDYLQTQDIGGALDIFDKPVGLRNLQWGNAPELVDLNGDGTPDDMNGDGLVDNADKAWVLTISPKVAWQVPQHDTYNTLSNVVYLACGGFSTGKDETSLTKPSNYVLAANSDQKQLDPVGTSGQGDDLFVTVRTSDKMSRFEKFRAVVPASLPERAQGQRIGGVQFTTGPASSPQAAIKSNPDEDPEQDFYGQDMLEVNVPTRILDQTNQAQTMVIGGAATPTLALDLATNLDLTVDSGTDGTGADKSFTVAGKNWAANAFAKAHWLIDSKYESYQITGNSGNTLTLLSGTPRGGKWRIVKDPTFLEQLIVEFYNEGSDAEFNPASDLLPLNQDQQLSGVAIYRDNDNDPNNRNGVFDPGIDIPIALDVPPAFVGATGTDMQVKFVFSSPGTDDYAGASRDTSGNVIAGAGVSMAEQPRHRQWVQDTFGNLPGDPDAGADFFVVVRASAGMTPGDNFRVGIVNWGPNTPTEPDPDTWAGLAGTERNDYTKFEEFPWGQRGIGYISYFGEPQIRYFMDGATAKVKADNSGFNWVRSHSTKKRRSGAIKAITRPVGPTSLVISGASQTQLPPQILTGEDFKVIINGKGFGTNPDVHLSGYTVQVTGASDTSISLSLTTPPGIVPREPLVLIVRNPATEDTQSRSDLFTLNQVSTNGPRVAAVVPARGDATAFPVTVQGLRFPALGKIRIYFGATLMNVKAVSADGTSALVEQPAGGLPGEGLRNVTVQELKADNTIAAQDTLVNGFDYVNHVVTPTGKVFFLCAPGGPANSSNGGDLLLVGGVLALLAGGAFLRRPACEKQ